MITTGQYKVTEDFKFETIVGDKKKEVTIEKDETVNIVSCSKEKGLCVTSEDGETIFDVDKQYHEGLMQKVELLKRLNEECDCDCEDEECDCEDCFDDEEEAEDKPKKKTKKESKISNSELLRKVLDNPKKSIIDIVLDEDED